MSETIRDRFKSGMRQLAGAVNLITTVNGTEKQGLTATAVCSLTVDPPTLIACVNKSASAHDTIEASGFFCVNVLAEKQRHLAELFADNNAIAMRFAQGEWTSLTTGAPVLEGCLCSFDCQLVDRVDRSTHTLFIGDVVGVSERRTIAPLLYFDGSYETLSVRD